MMAEFRSAVVRAVWRWLGYTDGLPVNMADLRRHSQGASDEIVRRVTEVTLGIQNDRRQVDIACSLLSGHFSLTDEEISEAMRAARRLMEWKP